MLRLTTALLFGCLTVVKIIIKSSFHLNGKMTFCHYWLDVKLTYSDKRSSYENLIGKDNSVSIHHKNIQAL